MLAAALFSDAGLEVVVAEQVRRLDDRDLVRVLDQDLLVELCCPAGLTLAAMRTKTPVGGGRECLDGGRADGCVGGPKVRGA